MSFQFQEMFFPVQPSREAGEGVVAAHHAVAGDHYKYRISVVGKPHRPRGIRVSYARRDVLLAAGLAVGDALKLVPDAALKLAAPQVERNVEAPALF